MAKRHPIRFVHFLLATLLIAALAQADPAAAQKRVPDSRMEMGLSFAPVVKGAAPAVVNVYAKRVVRSRQSFSPFADDPFFQRFFGGRGFGVPRERVQQSLGSGVVVAPEGVVVTNNHVVAEATDIRVALPDRREFEAEVVLKDERTDLAVLRIKDGKEAFPYLQLADSDAVEVGDLVLAIGNPFGVGQTVTSGIISAVARTHVGVSDYQFFIQTDAAINPGNSGGALVDMAGQVVGINSAIFSRSGGSHGVGFAIPANMVRVVVESAKTGDTVRRPWFGADLQAVTPDIADSLGLSRPAGVLVSALAQDGPAAAAGLAVGDVVLSVDGQAVDDPEAFNFRFATRGVGGNASLGVVHDARAREVTVALQSPPEIPPREETLLAGRHPLQGARVVNLSPAVAEELGADFNSKGVVVIDTAEGSPARDLRLQRGDMIREINDTRIDTMASLKRALTGTHRRWKFAIERGGRILTVVLGG